MVAGDWIKMRGNLWDDPRVSAIVDATDTSEAAIVGGLYWLWATADQHTEDGTMPGLTLRQIDRKTGIAGFGQAVANVGWIEAIEGGIRISRFEEHNGASAKKRCQTAKRVAKHKASDDQVTPKAESGNAVSVSDALPREEKEIDQEKKQKQERASPTGSRLPADFVMPADWIAWAKQERPDVDVDREASNFADHWHAKAGKDARKADWLATWRRWIRSEWVKPGNPRAGPGLPRPASATRTAAETLLTGTSHAQHRLDQRRTEARTGEAVELAPKRLPAG